MSKEKQDNIEFGLLENGLDFIQSAINFLTQSEDKSNIKYGLLHLSSGVELIFKYRLFTENWELLFQIAKNANKQDFVDGNFKSVDFKTCIERLEKECNLSFDEIEKDALKELRNKRNKMEHFSLTDSKNAITSYLNQILSIVIDFIEKEIPTKSITILDSELIDSIRNNISD